MKYVIGGLFTILSMVLNGLVVSILWGWFVVPALNAPAITIPIAIGLCSVAGLMLPLMEPPKEADSEPIWVLLLMSFGRSLSALGFGALVHLFA
jgi:hypothetical protein